MTYDNVNAEDVNPLLDFGQEFNNEEPKMWFKVLESNMLTRGMEAVLVSNSPIKVQKVCRALICRENQGDTPYKDRNMMVIKNFGPKDTDKLTKVELFQLGLVNLLSSHVNFSKHSRDAPCLATELEQW